MTCNHRRNTKKENGRNAMFMPRPGKEQAEARRSGRGKNGRRQIESRRWVHCTTVCTLYMAALRPRSIQNIPRTKEIGKAKGETKRVCLECWSASFPRRAPLPASQLAFDEAHHDTVGQSGLIPRREPMATGELAGNLDRLNTEDATKPAGSGGQMVPCLPDRRFFVGHGRKAGRTSEACRRVRIPSCPASAAR